MYSKWIENFTHKALYAITIIIFLACNIVIYNYFLYVQKEKTALMITGYSDSVGNLILRDLKVANNDSISNKTFYMFKKFSISHRSVDENMIEDKLNSIRIMPYAIYIKNPTEEIILDLQEAREILNGIFPTFVNYTISINNHNIALGERSHQTFNLRKDYIVDLNTVLTLQAGIKKDSSFYILDQNTLHKNILITIVSSFLSCSLLLYCYLKSKIKREEKFDILEDALYVERKINKALLSNKKISQRLNKLFIFVHKTTGLAP